MRFRR